MGVVNSFEESIEQGLQGASRPENGSAWMFSTRADAVECFRAARYGLFIHYGLYSLLGRHEWVQYREKIPVAEYAKLADDFTAERFDADEIARFAALAGFRYVTFTTRHHDSFCLWDTDTTDFNSIRSPARRDLVAEMVEACARHGLGCFLYLSHGRDWRHPHAANNDRWGGQARPEYDPPEPAYAYGRDHCLDHYVDYVKAQTEELLTRYSPVAGIWFDGIMVPMSGPTELFRCDELYSRIRSLSPSALISYKQGLLGTEDFFSPEHSIPGISASAARRGKMLAGAPTEVCTTMCPGSWGYSLEGRGKHKNASEVWEELVRAAEGGYNLLLNTGPLPDGSLDQEDVVELLKVGNRLAEFGFPSFNNGKPPHL